ncbi:MAG: transcriptional regulator [Rhizobiaceae bacterium]|nr:MAG: transcriptional regulator [Rhizobiaceae bacterium]
MPDPQEAESARTSVEAPTKPTTAEPKKRAARPRKAKVEAGQPTAKKSSRQSAKAAEASAPAVRASRRTYSQKERAQKLSQIEKSIAGGATTKSAVGQVGISEQTYYQWKKAVAPSFESDELKDLVALEEENKRLKKMLAERLRKENAELKNKLGLA